MRTQKHNFLKGIAFSTDDSQVNVNVAPLVDLLVIMVVFLVVSQTAIRLRLIDAGVVAKAGDAVAPSTASLALIQLRLDHRVFLTIGKDRLEIPAKEGTWDLTKMQAVLSKLKQDSSNSARAELQAEEGVAYGDLVHVTDVARHAIANVSLNIDPIERVSK